MVFDDKMMLIVGCLVKNSDINKTPLVDYLHKHHEV